MRKARRPPISGAFWLASVLHFYSGQPLHNLSGVDNLVGIAMFFVAVAAYRVASDTSDIKGAVQHIADLATQTKREADELGSQFALLKRQAVASETLATNSQGQLTAAQSQTKAISKQTDAIRRSAIAEIRSASAQEKSAIVAIQARLPVIRLTRAWMEGLGNAPDKDGIVHFTMNVSFANFGGSAIYNPHGTVYPFIEPALPQFADFNGPHFEIGINNLSVMPGLRFGGAKSGVPLVMKKTIADQIESGGLPVFVYGIIDYTDSMNAAHRFCFAYRMT